jgi:hypothetical protein
MKSIWKRKWLVTIGALVIFLSIGAAAWAAAEDNSPVAAGDTVQPAAGTATTVAAEQPDQETGALQQLRQAAKDRWQQWLKHEGRLYQAVRNDMTPEDQARYDQLLQTVKDKRAALQEARKELSSAMKDLRELVDQYLDKQS